MSVYIYICVYMSSKIKILHMDSHTCQTYGRMTVAFSFSVYGCLSLGCMLVLISGQRIHWLSGDVQMLSAQAKRVHATITLLVRG